MDFKRFLPWIIVAVLIIGIYSWASGIYNTAVTLEQNVKESWGNVNTAYQRRNDLIPNIVSTVKGYAEHEKSTLTAVIEARAKATAVTIDPTKVTPEQLAADAAGNAGQGGGGGRRFKRSAQAFPAQPQPGADGSKNSAAAGQDRGSHRYPRTGRRAHPRPQPHTASVRTGPSL